MERTINAVMSIIIFLRTIPRHRRCFSALFTPVPVSSKISCASRALGLWLSIVGRSSNPRPLRGCLVVEQPFVFIVDIFNGIASMHLAQVRWYPLVKTAFLRAAEGGRNAMPVVVVVRQRVSVRQAPTFSESHILLGTRKGAPF